MTRVYLIVKVDWVRVRCLWPLCSPPSWLLDKSHELASHVLAIHIYQPLSLRAGFCLLMVLFFRCLSDDLLGRNDLLAKPYSLLWLHLRGGGGVLQLLVCHPVVMTVNKPLSHQFFFLGHLCLPLSLLFLQPDPPFLLPFCQLVQ